MQTRGDIEKQFGSCRSLRFEETQAGLVHAVVASPEAEADVYLQGAHVASWTPAGERPVLFTSERSDFLPGKAIRGGIPVIFPWFGPCGNGLPGPSHGFVRAAAWRLSAAEEAGGIAELVFNLDAHDVADAYGYTRFTLQLKVRIGATLELELTVRNPAEQAVVFEEALHSYFSIGDIGLVSISGLERTTYIDKTEALTRKGTGEDPIHLTRETDQVHLNTTATCVIEDAVWHRRIVIEKSGSDSTVLWNPWAEKTRALKDMDPEEWHGMVCVETANAADNAVTLQPGGEHVMRLAIRVESEPMSA